MANKLTNWVVAFAIGGALVMAVGGVSCGDDNNNVVSTGGTTGTAGHSGVGGTGGGNAATFNMQLTGANEVPPNPSTATANVTVTLNRTTGTVTVTGTFTGLSSMATLAHIHGPAAVGMTAVPIMPLTVSMATSGTVTGTTTMTSPQMNDMMNGMTYVNIHSTMYPDGEIRAQILP
jgi:CHRD domain